MLMPLLPALAAAALPASCAHAPVIRDYFSQPLPKPGQVLTFAPGTLSRTGRREGNVTFTRSGHEMYFTLVQASGRLQVHRSQRHRRSWSTPTPVKALHEGTYGSWEAFVGTDERTLLFVSNRPPGSPPYNGRIFRSERQGRSWNRPKLVKLPIETKRGLWFPSLDCTGTIYFSAFLERGRGKGDLYRARRSATGWAVDNLGPTINSEHEEWDPFVAPDGRYLLFASDRPGGVGKVDIYVSYRQSNGEFGRPINVGPPINSPGNDVAARVTPDGRVIFFDRPTAKEQDVYWARSSTLPGAPR